MLLTQISPSGDTVWERLTPALNGASVSLSPHGLRRIEGGYLVFGARGSIPWVLRTGPWGHGDCTGLGSCGAQSEASCDDGNPCTADSCAAATGACLHAPVSGPICGAGKVCSAGACVTAP